MSTEAHADGGAEADTAEADPIEEEDAALADANDGPPEFSYRPVRVKEERPPPLRALEPGPTIGRELRVARKFRSRLSLGNVLSRLREMNPSWDWHKRDSSYYGDYLSALLDGHQSRRARVFVEADGYVLQVSSWTEPDAESTSPAVENLSRLLLDALDATDIHEDDGYD